ncbi:uncharacterized protein F5147DRAFT_762893 [Suillus discolor]|uniref:Uncharacterized protein n=1 Tax=Suillus discolor TaxID=1912936 RepID=A0A9P7JR07_9AGAM|nr:uncharacterized protein F5147DRAFT_762893 [Suillus discolor]KAG2100437.1 hypothetical protein F5147DRAFT_762893 [Suillus discolor]
MWQMPKDPFKLAQNGDRDKIVIADQRCLRNQVHLHICSSDTHPDQFHLSSHSQQGDCSGHSIGIPLVQMWMKGDLGGRMVTMAFVLIASYTIIQCLGHGNGIEG